MNYFGKLWTNLRGCYSEVNRATLTGAIDVIVIEQEDGSFRSTPFHVRFGKTVIFHPKEKLVDIYVNEKYIPDLEIHVGLAGEGYFEIPHQEDSDRNDETTLTNSVGETSDALFQMDDDVISQKPSYKELNQLTTSLPLPSPIVQCKSDTELDRSSQQDLDVSWKWGQLPDTKQRRRSVSRRQQQAVKKPEKSGEEVNASNVNNNGIYLCDIHNTMERNMYLYNIVPKNNDTDRNSVGSDQHGSSIRRLPIDSESDVTEFCLSLCGGLDEHHQPSFDRFLQHLITFEDFQRNPVSILNDSDLVVRWEGQFFTWNVVAPLLVSYLAFHQPLPDEVMQQLATVSKSENSSPEKSLANSSSPSPTRTRRRDAVRNWFGGWRRTDKSNETPTSPPSTLVPPETDFLQLGGSSLPERGLLDAADGSPTSGEEGGVFRGGEVCYSDGDLQNCHSEELPRHHIQRTIRLTSDQIKLFNLVPGANEVVYSITTRYQGTCKCACYIYLWKWTDKIVISDIDGTITRSDVVGQLYPLVGGDWTQAGVVRLYREIQESNYRFIYLSARSIGQAGLTRDFLQKVRQSDLNLPDGALLLSPGSMLTAFKHEVIIGNPDEFKIACLKDVQNLFPDCAGNPLYAGFGNKATDLTTYRTLGIDPNRIFIVNRYGVVKQDLETQEPTSYDALSEVVKSYFPTVDNTSQ